MFLKKLKEAVGASIVQTDESLSLHTTFKIGGPADYYVIPANVQALVQGIEVCKEYGVDYFILGNGSNLLVGDGGFRGVIFHLYKTLDSITIFDRDGYIEVTAGAGVMLSRLARLVSDRGFTGFEYATGIPGTLGGGITMNAGAYNGEISNAICWANVLNDKGEVICLSKEDLHFSYRHSVMMEKNYVVLEAQFVFYPASQEEITKKVLEYSEARKTKQPLEYPSAGSTFKRPEGYFAGKLIQDCGLKGYRVGDAMVSEKHSGFVINVGKASAKDVCDLISYIQEKVRETYHVELETEIRKLGDF